MGHDDSPWTDPQGEWSDPERGEHHRDGWRDRRRPGDRRAPGPLPSHLDVPDDAAELDVLVPGIRHELRWERRRRRLRRLLPSSSRLAWLLPIPLVLTTCVVASLMIAFGPKGSSALVPAPLASRASAPPGRVGGLLPDVTVTTTRGATVALRDRRPGALAVLPPGCDCRALLDRLFDRVGEYDLQLDVALPAEDAVSARRLVERIGNGAVVSFVDDGHLLRRTFDASGVTLILVDPSGLVTQIVRDVQASDTPGLDLARISAAAT